MRLLLAPIIFVFQFSLVNAQQAVLYADKNFDYVVHRDSTLSGDSVNFDCNVKQLVIKTKQGVILQQIAVPETYFSCDLPKDQVLIIEDVNFDGKNDLRIVQFVPAGPNVPYYYWLYDSATRRFKEYKDLEEITSPEFDHKNKKITSQWRSGCCEYGTSHYQYISGKPVLVEESTTALDENDESKVVTTIKKRVNGKMKVIKRTVGKRTK